MENGSILDLQENEDYKITITLDDIKKEKYYKIHSKHRSAFPTEKASIWDVSYSDEIKCFKLSIENKYFRDSYSWGFLIEDGSLLPLGRCIHNGEISEIKLAKFNDGNNNDYWHGWPFNYKRNGDVIPDDVLEEWVKAEVITRVKMSKIKQKKKCNL